MPRRFSGCARDISHRIMLVSRRRAIAMAGAYLRHGGAAEAMLTPK